MRQWPERLAWLWIALWLAGTSIASTVLLRSPSPLWSGATDGLSSVEHRPRTNRVWLLLERDPSAAPAEDGWEEGDDADVGVAMADDALDRAAARVALLMPDARMLATPPANAVTTWLDQHGLYLVSAPSLSTLAATLEAGAVTQSAADLRARLSSPLFGVSGSEARRDPLGLRGLITGEGGRLGHVDDLAADAPTPTLAGDLRSADGQRLLVALRVGTPMAILEARVAAATAGLGVRARIVGPAASSHRAARRMHVLAPRVLAATLGALAVALALSLRTVGPTLLTLVILASVAAVAVATLHPVDPLTLPLVIAMIAITSDLGLQLHPMSTRGWASALLVVVALLPLALLPYPVWKAALPAWAITTGFAVVALRGALPAIAERLDLSLGWPGPGFLLAPMPLLALCATLGSIGAGVVAAARPTLLPIDRVAMRDIDGEPAKDSVVRDFFDPDQLVGTCSVGPDAAAALERSATAAEYLAALVPKVARRVDAPGSYVVAPHLLAERQSALVHLSLGTRMAVLEDSMREQGLRADAFGEFLRGATDLSRPPTAARALEGPLGEYLTQSLEPHPQGVCARATVELRDDDHGPDVVHPQGDTVPLEGPRAGARVDAARFLDRCALAMAVVLWAVAFVIWLATGNMAIALSAACVVLAAQGGTLWVMSLLRQPIGAHVLPALMFVGITAAIAAGRCCKAVDDRAPLVGGGVLVTAALHVGVGLALVVGREPLWHTWGIVMTCGSALAAGLGLFVAPGLCWAMRRLAGVPTPPLWGEDDEDEENDE